MSDPAAHEVARLFQAGRERYEAGDHAAAIGLFGRVVELRPADAHALIALGLSLQGAGRPAEAETRYRQALALHPEPRRARVLLIELLVRAGRRAEALPLIETLVGREPGKAENWQALAEILLGLSDLAGTVEAAERALALEPDRVRALDLLGCAQRRLYDDAAALRAFARAVELAPERHELRYALGSVHARTGAYAEALAHFDRALSLTPGFHPALAARASVLDRLGRRDEGVAIIRAALARGDDHFRILGMATALLPDADERADAARRLDALLDTPLTCTDEERMDAHYTLGEYFDRYGQYDLAFKHMTAGNALRPTRYDAARTRRAVDIMEATTTREFMERAPRSTRTSALPVFIVGMPRSGTTLIEQVLGRHSRVHAAGELLDIQNIGREIDQTLGAPEGFPACMSRIGVADLDRRADAYLERLRGFDATAERVIDKLPANWMFLGLIAQMLPGARIIHARRHPLDTCLSCYQQNFSYGLDFSLRLETLADHYLDYRRLMRHWQSVLTLPMIEVVYEEHIEDPEGTARRLVEFLGLAWEDQCLDHRSERIVRTASYEQVRQPIYRGSVARWKRYATHLAVLESRLAEYL